MILQNIRFLASKLQITPKLLYCLISISLVVAIGLFPVWQDVFVLRKLPLEVKLSAPGVEIVKAYWNNPSKNKEDYDSIAVNPVDTKQWNVEVDALPTKNMSSTGFEVAILDIRTSQEEIDWSETEFVGEWEIRESPGSPQGKAIVAYPDGVPARPTQEISIEGSLEGGDLEVELFVHRGAGKINLKINGIDRTIDLYRPRGGHEVLTFPALAAGDDQYQSYQINVPATLWRRLKFLPASRDNKKAVDVAEVVRADGINLKQNSSGEYLLPFFFWNRFTCSLLVSSLYFCLVFAFCWSLVYLWNSRFISKISLAAFVSSSALILSTFWTLVYYPAIMSPDSLDQWQQAINNRYSDWHPPLMTLGMRAVLFFTESPALFALIQGTLLYLSVYLLTATILDLKRIPSRLQVVVLCLIPFVPTLWNYSVTLWKDVWLAISLLLMLASLLKLQHTKKAFWFIAYCILFGISLSFRKSIIFYFPFFVINSCIYLKWLKSKFEFKPLTNALLAILASILVIFPLGFPKLINLAASAQETHQEGKAILYDIIGTYINTSVPRQKKFDALFAELINEGRDTSHQSLVRFYSPITGDDYVWHPEAIFNYDKVEESRLQLLNFLLWNCILRNPDAYLAHKSQVWSHLLGFHGLQYPYDYGIYHDNPLGLQEDSKLPVIRNLFVNRILPESSNSSLAGFFLPKDVAIYFTFLTVASIFLQRRSRSIYPRNSHLIPLLVAALSLVASFMFLTPVVNFRYVFASCVILLCIVIAEVAQILAVVNMKSKKSFGRRVNLVLPASEFKLLSVIIPVYNEESTISQTLEKLSRISIPGIELEVIITDDCSSDNTLGEIDDFLQRYSGSTKFLVTKHKKNFGKGRSLKTAFDKAKGDILIIQDADLEYDSDEIPSIIEPILAGKADVVYGSRFMTKKASRVLYYYHYLANKFLTFLSNLFTNMNMTDIETGYKAFRAEIINNMVIDSSRFGFEVEVTAKIAKTKCRVYEVPISYYGRTYEEGKKIGLADGIKAIFLIFYYNIFVSRRKSFRSGIFQ